MMHQSSRGTGVGKMKKELKSLALEIAVFVAVVAIISLFWLNNILVLAALLVLWIVAIRFWHSKKDIIFFVLASIIGPLAEIVCIHFGAWAYFNPSAMGIPVWLPLAWGFAGLLTYRFALFISSWRGWE